MDRVFLYKGFLSDEECEHLISLDIYCLDADSTLFDAALLAVVAAFSHYKVMGMIYHLKLWLVHLPNGHLALIYESKGLFCINAKNNKEE
ncbi:putative ribosomal protein S5 domain 2-type [Helianthus anomalus]